MTHRDLYGKTIQIDCDSFTLTSDGITFNGPVTITSSVNVQGTITTSAGIVNTGGVTNNGAIVNNSTVTNNGAVTTNAAETISASGSLTNQGPTTLAALTTTGNTSLGGTLGVTGNSTLTGSLTVNNTGRFTNNVTVTSGGITVTGNSSVAGNFTMNGNLNWFAGSLTLPGHSGMSAWGITATGSFQQGFANATGACTVTNLVSYQYYRVNNWCYAQLASFQNGSQSVGSTGPIIFAGFFNNSGYYPTVDTYVGTIMVTDNGTNKVARILVRSANGNVEISNLDGSNFTTTLSLGIGGVQQIVSFSFPTGV